MPIPNEADASFPDQSELDTGDIAMGEMPAKGSFQLTGGAVTAQGSPDGTVAVSAGTARLNSSNKTISAGNVSVITGSANPDGTAASAADATLARFSLITLNSSSQLGVIHGTPAGLSPSNDGSYLCVFPAVDKSKLILAAVFVPPGFTTIASSQIIDKRITGSVDASHDAAHSLTGTNHAAGWGGNGYLPYGLTTTTGTTLALGSRGQLLRTTSAQGAGDSTTADALEWSPSPGASPYGCLISDDLMSQLPTITANQALGALGLTFSGAGTQATNGIAGTANHPGVLKLETGTTTTGRAALQTANNMIALGAGRCRWGAWVYIPVLSVVAQRFEVVCGFADGFSSATIVDGCFIHYRDDINSGKWEAITSSNSVTTATVTDTAITVAATTWYYLEANVAADGSSVTYYINGTAVATHSANVPTGAGRECGFYMSILKSLGTTTEAIDIDAYFVNLGFTTAR